MNRKPSLYKTLNELSIVRIVRCLAVVSATSLIFMVLSVFTVSVVVHPARYIKVSAADVSAQDTASFGASEDPNWDGALMGFGLGYAYGGHAPLLGSLLTAVLGGVVGYQLDKSV